MGIVTNRYTGSDSGGSGSSLTVRELDGVPTVNNVNTIQVSNGTLVDNGGGVVTLSTGGGGTTLTVSDGVTSVAAVTNLNFTAGATVTSGGAGIANVSIAGGGTIGGSISTSEIPYGTAANTVGGDRKSTRLTPVTSRSRMPSSA